MALNKSGLKQRFIANLAAQGANTEDENLMKMAEAFANAIIDEITENATVKSNSPYGCSAGGVTGYMESKIT